MYKSILEPIWPPVLGMIVTIFLPFYLWDLLFVAGAWWAPPLLIFLILFFAIGAFVASYFIAVAIGVIEGKLKQ